MQYTIRELMAEVDYELKNRADLYKGKIADGTMQRADAVEHYKKMQAIRLVLELSVYNSITATKKGSKDA